MQIRIQIQPPPYNYTHQNALLQSNAVYNCYFVTLCYALLVYIEMLTTRHKCTQLLLPFISNSKAFALLCTSWTALHQVQCSAFSSEELSWVECKMWWSTVHCINVPVCNSVHKCNSLYQFTSVLVYRCTSVPVYQCTIVCQCTAVHQCNSIPLCTSVIVYHCVPVHCSAPVMEGGTRKSGSCYLGTPAKTALLARWWSGGGWWK